ncbi:FtsH protease activity modulator HflK [Lutibaculum baratangense]|uniref:Protein HflK n=1 Tax=Lutibaculum baratangense AMV1 TaxID=631454 RepID=V4RWA4_9HYPH|nr:FtsH protease activity modulator HflK [Lutibaculum baratangense]ESR27300.1 HflK protein [Lutibaculum baratangense AMV1]
MPWNNQSGGGWRGGGGGPWGAPPSGPGGGGGGSQQPPDLEEILRRSQDRLRNALPGGSLGGRGLILIVLVLLAVWAASGFYRVEADEQGVVLRFGKYVDQTNPGLNYHLPWPIETALTPKVTRENQIDIGMRMGPGGEARDVPEESLILTGDENIVDVDFSIFWVISNAGNYLFNIQNPEGTVKAVAESAMREVIGRSQLQPVLTQARAVTEQAVFDLMQQTLDSYESGIRVTRVQLQKVDPPAAVIDAFRDVQAARADQERLRNEAQSYANRVVPEARGRSAQITEQAEAYREQTVAEAQGQADRFEAILNEYEQAPSVTRRRMFLETMERVLGSSDKVIMDQGAESGNGVVPYLPLEPLQGGTRPSSNTNTSASTRAVVGGNQ